MPAITGRCRVRLTFEQGATAAAEAGGAWPEVGKKNAGGDSITSVGIPSMLLGKIALSGRRDFASFWIT